MAYSTRCFTVSLTMFGLAVSALADDTPMLDGQSIDAAKYHALQEDGQLPLVAELSDVDLARKLNLDLPVLAEVKSALARNDAAALEKSLAEYLNLKIPPQTVKAAGKPAKNGNVADRWLKNEIQWAGKKYALGERVNWWAGLAPGSDGTFFDFGVWLHPLTHAYRDTGDAKYAQAVLNNLRSFCHHCRPPRKPSWEGRVHLGFWAPLQSSARIKEGYVELAYRWIGRFRGVSDADRVMLLKLFWETADYCYRLTATRSPHNIEAHVLDGIVNMAVVFPEFRDAPRWRDRAALRFGENMHDCVLDDGGAAERTGYHFAYIRAYLRGYVQLKNAGTVMPDAFRHGLEDMVEWSMWMLAPTLEYPLFGHGGLGPMTDTIEHGVELFPERKDFAYAASGGRMGRPPSGIARVLWHTGRVTMRSDWSRDALYLALCYNLPGYGPTFSREDHLELLSFGLWASGAPLMTNSGSTANYSTPEYEQWCTPTISDNTVVVNRGSSERFDGCGRLESWANVPSGGAGFTYLAAVGEGYRRFGVQQRRAVLFVRPSYWLVYDVLMVGGKVEKPGYIPRAGLGAKWKPGQPCELSWLGHFQPTELTVDEHTKALATAATGGKRFWLVPARPETLRLAQESTPIIARSGDNAPPPLNPNRTMGRTISLTKSNITAPTAFTVLLCPGAANAPAPRIENLAVTEDNRTTGDHEAIGCRVRRGAAVDILALALQPALRQYGPLTTDAEVAYVRLEGDRVVEAGLSRGRVLEYAGKRLMETGSEIGAARARFDGAIPDVQAEGRGEVVVCRESRPEARLCGKGEVRISFGKPGRVTLDNLQFSTKSEDVLRAIGVPGTRDAKGSVALTWRTAVPAAAQIEYRKVTDSAWLSNVNPQPLHEHRFALSRLQNGQTYQFRIMSRSEDGLPGVVETTYTYQEKQVAKSK